jgi:cytochrome c oxidase assembly protein subunit 11
MSETPHSFSRSRRRDMLVAGACGAFVAGMVGMAYASVPLYDWFCRVTGFNGTTQVATTAPAEISDRIITVRFDSNVGAGLPWKFIPERTSIDVRIGEVVTVHYAVANLAARETTGIASYNVTPLNWGAYFQKINCFCFTEQTLKAGEKRDMAVVFYVDPALLKDGDVQEKNTITLSYTFYPQREPQKPLAERKGEPQGRI